MLNRRSRGFTLIELMIVVAIIGILASIAIPNFVRFQARARQAEVNANLKSLFTALRSQQQIPTGNIRAVGFSPERGNRYEYLLGAYAAANTEDRTAIDAVQHNTDVAIGVDTFKHTSLTDALLQAGMIALAAPTWNAAHLAMVPPLATAAGIAGTQASWGFLAYGVGDVDNTPVETNSDTWTISSSDGSLTPVCPATAAVTVSAGEPFNNANDVNCN